MLPKTVASHQSRKENYIDSPEKLSEFFSRPRQGDGFSVCAIDTEADSMHSYETKLCLIQFATIDELAIVDPLAVSQELLDGFADFVDRFDQVWMHGGDYDISLFRKTFHWAPRVVFDTQIAARLLGVQKFGLANLLEQEYGVSVSKQSQKADWSKRPLSDKLLAYAYNDVRYLIDLGERYVDRLKEAGRYDWFLESCVAARDVVLSREDKPADDAWKLSGWGKLSPKGLHYLKALWLWRDEECRRLDRPAFKFVNNQEIMRMVQHLESRGTLVPPKYLKPSYLKRLSQVVEAAKKEKEDQYPKPEKIKPAGRLEIEEERLEQLRRYRDEVAVRLGVEPTLIATRGALEKACAINLPVEERYDGLLRWQFHLLEPCISDIFQPYRPTVRKTAGRSRSRKRRDKE